MDNWHQEVCKITEKQQWYVIGWYEDEKSDYETAELNWETARQEEMWDNYRRDPSERDEGKARRLFRDDDFGLHVTRFYWYLHSDGTWNRLVCKGALADAIHSDVKPELLGLYKTEEEAERMMQTTTTKPDKFANYREYLDKTPPAGNIIEIHQEST